MAGPSMLRIRSLSCYVCALLYCQNADDSRRIRYAGIVAAVLSVAYILSGCIPLKDSHDFVNNDFTIIPVFVILILF